MRIRQYVYFGLWSDELSADDLTTILGVAPDAVSVRGARRSDPPVPVSHLWALECRSDSLDVGEQIEQVLRRIRPLASGIEALVADGNVTAGLEIVRYFDDDEGQPERDDPSVLADGTTLVRLAGQHQLLGWSISADDLALLALLRAFVDVDEYN
jgi:hypothetical protein